MYSNTDLISKVKQDMEFQWSVYREINQDLFNILNGISFFHPKQAPMVDISSNESSFIDTVNIFSNEFLKNCIHVLKFHPDYDIFSKPLYSRLIATSHILEDYLDFHGARNNKKWYSYREYVATIRQLSMAGFSQKHIINRLPYLRIDNKSQFQEASQKTHLFISDSIISLVKEILKKTKVLDISPKQIQWELLPRLPNGENLPFNIDDGYVEELGSCAQQRINYVKITTEFINIAREFGKYTFYKPYSIEKIKKLVPSKINEVEMRKFKMLVQNTQTYFDSYVIYGRGWVHDLRLRKLRSCFSIIHHLLRMMGRLLHIYELSHLNIGAKNIYKEVRSEIISLIDQDRLLENTVNYCLFYACHYFNEGQDLAKEILNENIEHSQITVSVPKINGFHMRPCLLITKIVEHYGGKVELCVGKRSFDGSSILDLQWAGGLISREKIQTVEFRGDKRALNDIKILEENNYCEDSCGKGINLPGELKYLK